MSSKRFGGLLAGAHPLRELFIHQREANIVLATVEEVVESLQLSEQVERPSQEMQLHARVASLHSLNGIERGPNAVGECLLRQPTSATRTIEVFAEFRECALHRGGERFIDTTTLRRAFK